MEIHGFEVEARAAAAAGEASEFGRWCASTFGVVPALAVLVPSMDAALAAVPGAREVAGAEGEDGRLAVVDAPGGVIVELVEPAPPGTYEARIDEFVSSASDLAGPPTDDLAGAVEAVVAEAWARIEALLDGVPHNKVLAVHLLLSQRSRGGAPDSPVFWQRSAASTLLSGFVGRGVPS